MAFTTYSAFADNATVSASQLNVIGENNDWFFSIRGIVSPPWISQAIGSQHYALRKHRYLHWKYIIPAGTEYDNFIKVFVNGNEIGLHDDGSELSGPATVFGSYDFNSGAAGTSLNNWFLVTTSYDAILVGSDHAILWYIEQSPLSTI